MQTKFFDYLLTGDPSLLPKGGSSSPVADGAIGALMGVALGVALTQGGLFGDPVKPDPTKTAKPRNSYRTTVEDAEDELLQQPPSPQREAMLKVLAKHPPDRLLSQIPEMKLLN